MPHVEAAAHAHSVYGKAWSSLGRQLDPITQDSCAFYEDHVLFDDFTGPVLDADEGSRIGAALGEKKAAILRNHGLLTVGGSVDAAAWWFIAMERSCQAQLLAEAAGQPIAIEPAHALTTRKVVGSEIAGWSSFQPLFDVISAEQPELFDQFTGAHYAGGSFTIAGMENGNNAQKLLTEWLEERGVKDVRPMEDWLASATFKTLEPEEYLVRAGEKSRHIYVVVSGLVRFFYVSYEGKERNKAFYGPGQLLGAVSAAISGTAAPFNIQATETATLVQCPFDSFYDQAAQTPAFAKLLIRLLSDAFIRNEQREAVLLTANAEQRYRWLLENEDHLVDRVSQYHLASYLGIDPVSLSRLKRRLGT